MQPVGGPGRSESLGRPLFVSTGLPDGYGDVVAASWALGVDSPQARAVHTQQVAVVRGAATAARVDPAYAPVAQADAGPVAAPATAS